MLQLLLLRHAEAVPGDGGSDRARQLTPEGRAAARRMGACLMAAGAIPDLTLVSPARRTIETLDEIEGALAKGLTRREAPSLYNASMAAVFSLIEETPPSIRVLLVIGHNPSIAEAADALSDQGSAADLARLRTQFPAPCLAMIALEAKDWRTGCERGGRLERFITLSVLQKSAEG